MRSGDAEIKGIKPKVNEEYSLSQGSGPSNDSWKSLMSSAKDTPLQYDHMNRESLKNTSIRMHNSLKILWINRFSIECAKNVGNP